MSRIVIRFATPRDAARLIADGLAADIDDAAAKIESWLTEQRAGRRLILVAERAKVLLGMAQLVFAFPAGYQDPEAANGADVAMMETLRVRPDAPATLAQQLMNDLERVARKRKVTTLTFCLPMESNRALAQAKAWGFREFRIMPEARKMLAFFRKTLE